MMVPDIDIIELLKIARGDSTSWRREDVYIGEERRWGFDQWVVFTENSDLANKFYRFSYYEGVGDADIDFERTPIEEVEKKTLVTYEWVAV
jgi:hypothetical protein